MSQPLSLRRLECFIAVAQELSFRRAAERLFISQPPLSRQIQMLEQELGARLFDRDRRSVRLTPAGEQLLQDAQALLRSSAELALRFKRRQAAAGPATVVRLGITTVVDVGLFSGLQAAFEAAWPGARLHVKRQISAHSIRDLQRGSVDVAVIGLPSRTEGLQVQPLFDDPLVACLSAGHRLARRRRISVLDLADDPLFWFERKLNPAYHDCCERIFERVGFAPQRLREPAEHPVLLGLIAEGQGVALVPASLNTVTRKGVLFKPIAEADELRIRVGVACRPDESSTAVQALVQLLKQRHAQPGTEAA